VKPGSSPGKNTTFMKTIFNLLSGVALVAMFASCTVGRKMSYENKEVTPGYTTTKTLQVGFLENREAVLSGKEKPSFCGHLNSTAQIDYNMQTESGKPLVDEFTGSVAGSLTKLGVQATPVIIPLRRPVDSVIVAFSASGRDRLLLFTLNQWESRGIPKFTTILYQVRYAIEVNVYDQSGKLMATAEVHDVFEKEDSDLATSVKKLQTLSEDIFREQMRILFNKENVKASLL
jgi:hypothetical protein